MLTVTPASASIGPAILGTTCQPRIREDQTDRGNHGKGNDTLFGLNLIGVVPFGAVDSFFGVGAALHSIDKSLVEDDPRLSGTDSKFGADAQFGIDIYITNRLSAFGTGRFDLVQGTQSRVQSKVYLGLRARF